MFTKEQLDKAGEFTISIPLENPDPQNVDGTYPMTNRDFHTMYVGEIVDAYIIK